MHQADEMITQGKLHSDVARVLGVSIMAYDGNSSVKLVTPKEFTASTNVTDVSNARLV